MNPGILLVRVPNFNLYGPFSALAPRLPHLGLLSLAQALRDSGARVSLLDGAMLHHSTINNLIFDIINLVNHQEIRLIAFTGLTGDLPFLQQIVQVVSRKFPGLWLVAGGPHFSALPLTGKELGLNLTVIGESEQIAPRLAALAATDKREIEQDFEIWKADSVNNLDNLPIPAWDLIDFSASRFFLSRKRPLSILESSRGCPYNCSFCSNLAHRKNFRQKSPQRFFEELVYLSKNYGIAEIQLADDLFGLDLNWLEELAGLIGRLKKSARPLLALQNGTRMELITRERLKLFKQIGVYTVNLGIESGSVRIFNLLKSEARLEDVWKATREIQQAGLECWGFFILGHPEETLSEARQTMKLALDLPLTVAKFSLLVPYPGTDIYRQYFKQINSEKLMLGSLYQASSNPGQRIWKKENYSLNQALVEAYRKLLIKRWPRFVGLSFSSQNRLKDSIRFVLEFCLSDRGRP